MFDPKNLESVKAAYANGELSAADIANHPAIHFTWQELEIADPVSKKFFGAYADEIALKDSPLVRATKAVERGDFESAVWQGRVIKATFFTYDGNAPRALVRFPNYQAVTVKSIDFGTLREIVFWLDYTQSQIADTPK